MAGLFYITDHFGNGRIISDRMLRNIIVKQSKKSNYSWLAPADELIKVCNKHRFNRAYAKDIEVAIVNCYANFLIVDCPSSIVYAYDAYNNLFDIQDDEQVLNVRKTFLRNFINRNILWNKYFGNIHQTFLDAKSKWIDDKIEELLKVRRVDFVSLQFCLVSDFEKYIGDEMNKGNVIEEYMKFHIYQANPDKKVYSDKDNEQKQSYESINKPIMKHF